MSKLTVEEIEMAIDSRIRQLEQEQGAAGKQSELNDLWGWIQNEKQKEEPSEIVAEENSQVDLEKILTNLTEKEQDSLREAVSFIYENDESEYLNGLWSVVIAILGDQVNEKGIQIEEILRFLDPELLEER